MHFIIVHRSYLTISLADATVRRLEHCYGIIADREKDFVTAAGA